MSGKRSRDKGGRGEREFAAFLTENGFPAERGCQRAGGPDSPDVKCPELDAYHHEVKRTEKLVLWPGLEQAINDAGPEQIPLLHHRPNRREWITIMRTEDFLRLQKMLQGYRLQQIQQRIKQHEERD